MIVAAIFRQFKINSLVSLEDVFASIDIVFNPLSEIPMKIEERKENDSNNIMWRGKGKVISLSNITSQNVKRISQ